MKLSKIRASERRSAGTEGLLPSLHESVGQHGRPFKRESTENSPARNATKISSCWAENPFSAPSYSPSADPATSISLS